MRAFPWMAAGAVVLVGASLTGCAGGGDPEPSGPQDYAPTAAQIEELVKDGTLPAGFPVDAERVRVIRDGDSVAVSWVGEGIDAKCSPSEGSVGSYAMPLLIMDAGLESVERCGDFWQAVQADDSRVAWNTAN